ncbi:MAG: acyl carrier protein [Firmicutes bacterium]|nr:acyl carrier protein [Bacillota bacterium]
MVYDAVAETIAERLECDVSEITRESSFEQLGIDSLDVVDLLMVLEEKIGMEIEPDGKIKTVGDLVDFIEKKKAELGE